MEYKRIAICFSGVARSIEFCHQNLKDCLVKDPEKTDIFFMLSDTTKIGLVRNFFKNYNTKFWVVRDINHDLSALTFDQGARNRQGYLNMLRMRQYMGKCLKSFAEEQKASYDCVVHSRMDVEYFAPVDFESLDITKISVPDFHSFDCVQGAGLNDRFAVGSLSNMIKYFNLYDWVINNNDKRIHGESTLKKYLDECKIDVDKVSVYFSRIRPDGTSIDLRLKEPKEKWNKIDL